MLPQFQMKNDKRQMGNEFSLPNVTPSARLLT